MKDKQRNDVENSVIVPRNWMNQHKRVLQTHVPFTIPSCQRTFPHSWQIRLTHITLHEFFWWQTRSVFPFRNISSIWCSTLRNNGRSVELWLWNRRTLTWGESWRKLRGRLYTCLWINEWIQWGHSFQRSRVVLVGKCPNFYYGTKCRSRPPGRARRKTYSRVHSWVHPIVREWLSW